MLQILNLVPYLCEVAIRQNTPQQVGLMLHEFLAIMVNPHLQDNNLTIENWVQAQGGWVSSYISYRSCLIDLQTKTNPRLLGTFLGSLSISIYCTPDC